VPSLVYDFTQSANNSTTLFPLWRGSARESTFFARLDGEEAPMCCAGCKAVAEAIYAAGLQDYYKTRTAYAKKAEAVPEFLKIRKSPIATL